VVVTAKSSLSAANDLLAKRRDYILQIRKSERAAEAAACVCSLYPIFWEYKRDGNWKALSTSNITQPILKPTGGRQ